MGSTLKVVSCFFFFFPLTVVSERKAFIPVQGKKKKKMECLFGVGGKMWRWLSEPRPRLCSLRNEMVLSPLNPEQVLGRLLSKGVHHAREDRAVSKQGSHTVGKERREFGLRSKIQTELVSEVSTWQDTYFLPKNKNKKRVNIPVWILSSCTYFHADFFLPLCDVLLFLLHLAYDFCSMG